MLKESIPTASARTASSTALRITWSPLIGRAASSTVSGTNVSRPHSSVDITCSLLLDCATQLLDSSNVCGHVGISAPGDTRHAKERLGEILLLRVERRARTCDLTSE